MKNYNEQLRLSLVTSGGSSPSTVVNASTAIEAKGYGENKFKATSGTPFSTLSAGDVIKVSGFGKEELDSVFTVLEVGDSGAWIKVNKPLIEAKAGNEITVVKAGELWEISGLTAEDYVNDAVNLNTASSAATEISPDDLAVTQDGKVAVFATLDSGDQILVLWSDVSKG